MISRSSRLYCGNNYRKLRSKQGSKICTSNTNITQQSNSNQIYLIKTSKKSNKTIWKSIQNLSEEYEKLDHDDMDNIKAAIEINYCEKFEYIKLKYCTSPTYVSRK